jgi:hypothetical protein
MSRVPKVRHWRAPDYYILAESDHNCDSQKHDVFMLAFIDDLRTSLWMAA